MNDQSFYIWGDLVAKTIIIGLGNPILTDDSVGPRVATELKKQLNDTSQVTIIEASVGGLALVDLMADFEKAIVIDAIQTIDGKPGTIYRMNEAAFTDTRNTASAHDVNFATALEFGHRMGMILPQQIDIYAIEAVDVITFSESCTPEIEHAIPICANIIVREMNGGKYAQSIDG